MKRAQPIASQQPEFYWADYVFAPVYNWHVRQLPSHRELALPDQILLHVPLRPDPLGNVQAAAKARNGQRGCLWWAEWEPTTLVSVFYAYNKTASGIELLVFYQPKPGYTEPFRLVVLPAGPWSRQHAKLWPWVFDLLISLPAMNLFEHNHGI